MRKVEFWSFGGKLNSISRNFVILKQNIFSMESLITTRPPRTIREVYDALPEGTLGQLIENQLVMSPSPTDNHQKVLNRINFLILKYLEDNPSGELRIAPYDVHLDDENVFQPDLIFIKNENLSKIEQNGFHGAPDVVIELLSPSTSKYDLGQKKAGYERHGVKEYWIVDPDSKDVKGYFLENAKYGEAVRLTGTISSRLLGEDFHF